ncbi:MAG: cell division protein ZapA [Candidatus Marinimicrobia bacterium]|nr:cell division protein ZapA [Candidatus Neomarinimicrobiota bacterium]
MSELYDKSVTVNIYGEDYNIRGKAESAFIEKVADYVDNKMQEIGANIASTSATHRIAILAAMNIAGELFQTLDEKKIILNTVNEKSEKLITAIEESLDS